MLISVDKVKNDSLACVAGVSVWFRSKERPTNGRARNEIRATKWQRGEGEGKEGNSYWQTPRFWKPTFASERSAWLARLVEQYWHVSIKFCFILRGHVWCVTRVLLSCAYWLFWSARFALQCKSIFFNFFWNTKLFLRLYKGFTSFNLSPGSE